LGGGGRTTGNGPPPPAVRCNGKNYFFGIAAFCFSVADALGPSSQL
jgi:hypothetical protein